MTGQPVPIKIDVDTWIVMRDDPTRPKALIKRATDRHGNERFLVYAWDVDDPRNRPLMAMKATLEDADRMVLGNDKELRARFAYPGGEPLYWEAQQRQRADIMRGAKPGDTGEPF